MKKQYQKPISVVERFDFFDNLLQVTSVPTETTPAGEGTPDDARYYDFDDELESDY